MLLQRLVKQFMLLVLFSFQIIFCKSSFNCLRAAHLMQMSLWKTGNRSRTLDSARLNLAQYIYTSYFFTLYIAVYNMKHNFSIFFCQVASQVSVAENMSSTFTALMKLNMLKIARYLRIITVVRALQCLLARYLGLIPKLVLCILCDCVM